MGAMMKYINRLKSTSFFSALVLSALFLISNSVFAELNFSGKTIKWVVPFSPGGGADVLARFYAPLLSQELPGKPNVSCTSKTLAVEIGRQIGRASCRERV